jgi:hypothetical protein
MPGSGGSKFDPRPAHLFCRILSVGPCGALLSGRPGCCLGPLCQVWPGEWIGPACQIGGVGR